MVLGLGEVIPERLLLFVFEVVPSGAFFGVVFRRFGESFVLTEVVPIAAVRDDVGLDEVIEEVFVQVGHLKRELVAACFDVR